MDRQNTNIFRRVKTHYITFYYSFGYLTFVIYLFKVTVYPAARKKNSYEMDELWLAIMCQFRITNHNTDTISVNYTDR